MLYTSDELCGRIRNLSGYSGVQKIWEVIPEARLVGGCVRDVLCRAVVHDIDLASPLTPEEAAFRLESAGMKVVPTGLEHGTITVVIDHIAYELTTLRRDVETDGRHAQVEWTSSWEEDAERRDFTINAMSLSRDGVLYDYFGGQRDLFSGCVRFVGNAQRRIEEDALRALRFFRFHARYGNENVDIEAREAITKTILLIKHLSVERIAMEMRKILLGPHIARTVIMMHELGLLEAIMPLYDIGALERLLACHDIDEYSHRLAALCPDPKVGALLKLSNTDQYALKVFSRREPFLFPAMDDSAIRCALFEQERRLLILRSWLEQSRVLGMPSDEWNRLRDRIETIPQPVFPIGGKEALALGVETGPAIGKWLKRVKKWWLSGGCVADHAECLAWFSEQVSSFKGD